MQLKWSSSSLNFAPTKLYSSNFKFVISVLLHLLAAEPLKFKPGDSEKQIKFSVLNDPSGVTRSFTVSIDDVSGRDVAGDVTTCEVVVANEASKSPSHRCE